MIAEHQYISDLLYLNKTITERISAELDEIYLKGKRDALEDVRAEITKLDYYNKGRYGMGIKPVIGRDDVLEIIDKARTGIEAMRE